jgi:pentatricopeptide repeat protein
VTYRLLASCYAHVGRLDEAREIVNRLRAITPVVVPSVIRYRNPEHRELFLSGLRLAVGEAHDPQPPRAANVSPEQVGARSVTSPPLPLEAGYERPVVQ